MNQPSPSQAPHPNPQRPAHPMFRDLSDAEAAEFRKWARDNYIPGQPINPIWHPVVRDECSIMCDEAIQAAVD
jgi:hypothetical protein